MDPTEIDRIRRRPGCRSDPEIREMLSDLRMVFEHPYLLDQCQQKTTAESLRGLSKWARYGRRCKACKRRLPPQREKCCSQRCIRRFKTWKRDERERKAGQVPWIDFARTVVKPLHISDVAARLDISLEEARRRAEADARRGRLVVWRGHRGGEVREVGRLA